MATIKKLEKEILHLRGKIKGIDEFCLICKSKRVLSEKYDSYYCPKCMYWLEKICPDRTCNFCKDRPKYPTEEVK